MEAILEACMAALLDAVIVVLMAYIIRRKANASVCEKVLCIAMLFGFALGMALGEVQHARAMQVLCGLGVILSYAAEGLAFAGKAQEEANHE